MIIREQMLADYSKGLLPSCFEPYFYWKLGKCELIEITREQAIDMMETAGDLIIQYYDKYPCSFDGISVYTDDNPWQNYEGYGEDKYIVSYLEAIDYELTNLWTGGFF